MKVQFSKDPKSDLTILNIEVPLTENKPSRSGNSTIVATSRGQQFIGKVRGRDTYLQLNVMQMEESGGGLSIVGSEETEQAVPKKQPQRAA